MIEQQIRDLFATTADGEPGPCRVDVHLGRRQGRARLRWRRASLAGAVALVAAVSAVLVVAVPAQPAPGPETSGPSAPRQFSPLVTNVAFGWLPPGTAVVQGYVDPGAAFLAAQGGSGGTFVTLGVYARGQCQLTDQGSTLKCRDRTLGQTARLSERAPDVNGHTAYWDSAGLIWSYASGGWAWLGIAAPDHATLRNSPALQAEAVAIASRARFGAATPHVAFPAQFTGLPSDWRVADAQFWADSGKLRAEKYTVATPSSRVLWSSGPDAAWSDAVSVTVQPNGTCVLNDPDTRNQIETINGARVIVTHTLLSHPDPDHPAQMLCTEHSHGLWLNLMEFSLHPPMGVARLFRHHVHLLGRNPANWTENPIG